jgi:hypothetical protein
MKNTNKNKTTKKLPVPGKVKRDSACTAPQFWLSPLLSAAR